MCIDLVQLYWRNAKPPEYFTKQLSQNWLKYCKLVGLNKKWEPSSQDLKEKSETEKNYWENLDFLKLETSSPHSGRAFLCLTLEWS